MRTFMAVVILSLFIGPAVLAGGGDWDTPQQQAAPQTKVVVVPADEKGESWAVPIAVAAVGAVGVVGAAYVSRRKGD